MQDLTEESGMVATEQTSRRSNKGKKHNEDIYLKILLIFRSKQQGHNHENESVLATKLAGKVFWIHIKEKVQITSLKYGPSPDNPFNYLLVQFGS